MLESLAVIRWAEGRWCSATWGEKIGQSCWSQHSRGCSPTRGSGRAAAAAGGGAGTAEEQRGTAGTAAGEEGRGRPSCTAQKGDEKVGVKRAKSTGLDGMWTGSDLCVEETFLDCVTCGEASAQLRRSDAGGRS